MLYKWGQKERQFSSLGSFFSPLCISMSDSHTFVGGQGLDNWGRGFKKCQEGVQKFWIPFLAVGVGLAKNLLERGPSPMERGILFGDSATSNLLLFEVNRVNFVGKASFFLIRGRRDSKGIPWHYSSRPRFRWLRIPLRLEFRTRRPCPWAPQCPRTLW